MPLSPNIPCSQSWQDILHLASRQLCPEGYPLVLEGTALTDFYYIEKGKILISYASGNGRERSIISLTAGHVFNISSALTRFDNPDSQYICKENTVLWRFPGTLLHSTEFICRYPALILDIMQSLASRNLRMHESLSYTGTDLSLIQVARWIQRISDDAGTTMLCPNMTQQELADSLGIHRATIVRCIHTLKKRGIIKEFTKNSLIISDYNTLKKLAFK